MSAIDTITRKLDQKPLESKKAIYAAIGTILVMFTFLLSLIGVVWKPVASGDIFGLANLVVIYLGAVTGVLITGQSLVDWKAMTAIQRLSASQEQRSTESLHVESNQPIGEINLGSRSPKDFYHDEAF